MKESTIYEKYLSRLKERRDSSPYYLQARREMRQLSPAFTDLRRTYEQRLRRRDLPEDVAMKFAIEQQQSWGETVGGIYETARTQEEQRLKQITATEEEWELKRDIALEREEEEERLKREAEERAKKGLLGKAVGTVLGGAIGFVAGGFNPLAAVTGAQIGGGVGGMAAGLEGGIDSIEEISMIETGLGQTLMGLDTIALTTKQSGMIKSSQSFLEDIKSGKYANASEAEIEAIWQSIQSGVKYE